MTLLRHTTGIVTVDTPLILNGAPLPTKNIRGIEVFDVGKWNGEPYSDKQIEELISNTNLLIAEGHLSPPAKIGHAETQTFLDREGYPAAGWVTRLYREPGGTKVMADYEKVPEKVAALIVAGAYRKVSSEIWRDYGLAPDGKRYGHVLKAISFLGEEIPAVNSLDDIVALYKKDARARVSMNSANRPADQIVTMSLSAPTTDEVASSMLEEFEQHIAKVKDSTKGKIGAPQMRALLTEAHAKIKALMNGGAKKNTALGTDESFEERRMAVQEAIDALFPPPGDGSISDYHYIEDDGLMADRVVVGSRGEYELYPYTMNADGTVTLGTPQPVDKTWTPKQGSTAFTSSKHSDATLGGEPPWDSDAIHFDRLPALAFAEGDKYPHHAMSDGALYLHLGGLRAALTAARNDSASAEVLAHLSAHAEAVGLEAKNMAEGADMDQKKIAKALGLDENASETDILAAAASNTEKAGKFAEAAKEVETFKATEATKTATATVEKAVLDKKIVPAQKEWALAYARKDPEAFAAFLKDAPDRFITTEKGHASGGVEGEGDARSTLSRLALKKVSESKGELSFGEALQAVSTENPDLAKEAAAPLN